GWQGGAEQLWQTAGGGNVAHRGLDPHRRDDGAGDRRALPAVEALGYGAFWFPERASSSSTSSPIFAPRSRTPASWTACSSSARALRLRSPPFTNVSIHPSTSDCLRSCSRHTSTSFRSPRIS